MSTEHQCPKCGAAIADNSHKGLCPRCLLAAAMAAAPAGRQTHTSASNPVTRRRSAIELAATRSSRRSAKAVAAWFTWPSRTEPVRRRVALKVIKLGMDTKQVIARFEAERQALALMDHPNIAKVLDAGATETGRPYFVMELVQGHPDHRLLRPAPALTLRNGWICSSRSARPSSTRTRRASSTATSSPRTSW